jgi:lytic murein transglycosylase
MRPPIFRRFVAVFAVAFAMAGTAGQTRAETEANAVPVDYKKRVEQMFRDWVEGLWPTAEAKGITRKTFDAAFKGVTLNWKLPEIVPPEVDGKVPVKGKKPKQSHKQQPEFDTPGRYFRPKIVAHRVKKGRAKIKAWNKALDDIEKRYGVQREIIMAVWGVETNFGDFQIPHYTIRALATGAFMGLRKDMFNKELMIALNILQEGHVTPAKMKSSWAGAMGHTQFMPSDFTRYAVDYDGDGKRDIWGTIIDALASTGFYLQSEGWERMKTWGYEIKVPSDFDCTLAGKDNARPISEWVKLGAKRSYGRSFAEDRLADEGILLMPGGRFGPAFIALKNFYVIKTYNNADLYALIVGHIADRYTKDRVFEGKWMANGFRRDVVTDMQKRLEERKLNVGGADGLIGFRTRIAIGQYQKDNGLQPTCWPTDKLIAHIKRTTPLDGS